MVSWAVAYAIRGFVKKTPQEMELNINIGIFCITGLADMFITAIVIFGIFGNP